VLTCPNKIGFSRSGTRLFGNDAQDWMKAISLGAVILLTMFWPQHLHAQQNNGGTITVSAKINDSSHFDPSWVHMINGGSDQGGSITTSVSATGVPNNIPLPAGVWTLTLNPDGFYTGVFPHANAPPVQFVTSCGNGVCNPASFDFGLTANMGSISGQVFAGQTLMPIGGGYPVSAQLAGDQTIGDGMFTDKDGKFNFNEGILDNDWGVSVFGPTLGSKFAIYNLGTAAEPVLVSVTSSRMSVQDLYLWSEQAPLCNPQDPCCPSDDGERDSDNHEQHPGPSPNAGEPVNLLNGNVWFRQSDAEIGGIVGINMVRSYNSLASSQVYSFPLFGTFGPGWTHSYEAKLFPLSGGLLALRRGNGSPVYFFSTDGGSSYHATQPVGELSRISHQADGTYIRTFRKGGQEVYDSQGRLTSIIDLSNNVLQFSYDSSGRLVAVTDPGSRALTFQYQGNKISSISGPDGPLANYSYDDNGLLELVRYADGSGYHFTYNQANQLITMADLSGRIVETHAYSGRRAITSELSNGQERYTIDYGVNDPTVNVTDALGNVTTYEWTNIQGMKHITKITGPCGDCGGGGSRVQEWTYDDIGRVVSYKDGVGKITTYTYDGQTHDVLTRTEPLPDNRTATTIWTYDAQGRILTETRADGGQTTYTYVAAGPATITQTISSTASRTTNLDYTPQGQLRQITDPLGNPTTLHYNNFGDLDSVADPPHPTSHTTSFGYDHLGRRITVTDALNRTMTTTYNPASRMTRLTVSDGSHTDFTYDQGGRRTTMTDPKKRITRYGYDDFGRLVTVIDPAGGATRYAYDAMSNLISLTDAENHVASFEYDAYNRVKKAIYPGGAFETFTYDNASRLLTKTDRKQIVTTYTYDEAGRLSGKKYSDGTPPVSYTHDDVGRMKSAANGSDTLTWTYDLAGELSSETSAKNSSMVAYTYDLNGNRLTLSLDGNLFVRYGYDQAGLLTTITRGGNLFSYGYDAAHRRSSMSYPNGVVTSYAYDELNRLLRLKADRGATPITDFQYAYDVAGNRIRKQQLDYTENYTYDLLDQLTGVDRSGDGANHWLYSYDRIGNRVTEQIGSTVSTSSYNERNEVLSRDGGGLLRWRGTLDKPGRVTFSTPLVNNQPAKMLAGNVFEAELGVAPGTNNVVITATDFSGNTTSKPYRLDVGNAGASYTYDANGNLTGKSDNGSTWVYTWNAENQLVKVAKDGSEIARYAYDPLGRRIEKAAATQTLKYSYDGANTLRQSGSISSQTYVNGPAIDEAMSIESGAFASYMHADGLRSVIKVTDGSGAITEERQYDVWGMLQTQPLLGNVAFTGRDWDQEAGLYYFRARYYDPKLGRFIAEDPSRLGPTISLYQYADGNPVEFIDPYGLASSENDPPPTKPAPPSPKPVPSPSPSPAPPDEGESIMCYDYEGGNFSQLCMYRIHDPCPSVCGQVFKYREIVGAPERVVWPRTIPESFWPCPPHIVDIHHFYHEGAYNDQPVCYVDSPHSRGLVVPDCTGVCVDIPQDFLDQFPPRRGKHE
jgi:RHS repeat-associated protein